ncbi:MAG: hypothetical protein RL417_2410 [Pseudomonadota bacterium]|jgi:hypothetical protein
MGKAQKLLKDASVIDARKESDTLRLWESYRDQAMLWRALALIQIPTTAIIALLCFTLYANRKIELKVPAKPLPGVYTAQEIPDSEFIDVATNFINLIATYQPAVARRQFSHARQILQEPMLERFNREMMVTELKTIESTSRTQIFFVDPTKTRIFREGNTVEITLTGERMKMVAGRQLPAVTTTFSIAMTTIPRNELNPYGIVINNVAFDNIDANGE